MTHAYGRIPDAPDIRDFKLVFPPRVVPTPPHVDLRDTGLVPPVWDQSQIGSCTAFGSLGAACYELATEKNEVFEPSWLAEYYWSRQIEHSTSQDAGAQIRDAVKALNTVGVAHSSVWPYDIKKFKVAPTKAVRANAAKHKVTAYRAIVQDLNQMRACLSSLKPIIVGFTVYDSFESAEVGNTGVVPMPSPGETVLGGHAVLVVGYDDPSSRFIVRNSWGVGWGQGGYFTMPYAYLTDRRLSSDFWTVDVVA